MKAKKRRSVLILSVIAAAALIVSVWLATVVGDFLRGSMHPDSTVITIPDGARAADIASILDENGIIRYPGLFRLVSRIIGVDGKYRYGEFEIKKGSGYLKLIKQLTHQSNYRNGWLTIPEGYTIKQIASEVERLGLASKQEFMAALDKEYPFDFLPLKKRDNYLEGYLFPDTYNFTSDMAPEDMIYIMLQRFDTIFSDAYRKRAKELGMSIDEVVILASMIEAEAGSDTDRPKVSSVFHNRLKSSETPYLESCATVQYILGTRKPILSTSDTQINSPYNTYINKGLPIGPICNPGEASIKAALYPENTNYYYFQSDANGKIYYAKTYEEHERIRRQIQK